MYSTDVKEINKIKDIDILEEQFKDLTRNYSFKPDREKYPFPRTGEILDEDQTVRWNKAEVERLRANYQEQVAKLQKDYRVLYNAYEQHFIKLLAKDNDVTIEAAKKIYAYAHEESHSDGVYAVRGEFEAIAELFNTIKEMGK